MPQPQETFATRVYVVGEVIISALVLAGGFALVYFGDQSKEVVGSGLLTGVTVFWFQRRAAEGATNQITQLANGNITQAMAEQHAQSQKLDATIALVAQSAARAREIQTANERAIIGGRRADDAA